MFKTDYTQYRQLIAGVDDAVLAAGIAAASQGANMAAQGKMNLKTRQFAEEMYFRQRADALSDWDKQNAYNSPAAQMERYKAAGLNPNLIYGKGQMSDAVRSTPMQSWSPQAPKFDAGSVIGAYTDTKMKSAQQDMMAKQKQLIDMEIANKAAQTENVQAQTASVNQQTAQAAAINPYSLQAAEQNVQKTKQEMDIASARNEREALTNNATLLNAAQDLINKKLESVQKQTQTNETKQQIENLKQQLELLKKDSTIKDMDIQLRGEGKMPNDPYIFKKFQDLLNMLRTGVEKLAPNPWARPFKMP